jgi:hypothetical protein
MDFEHPSGEMTFYFVTGAGLFDKEPEADARVHHRPAARPGRKARS